MHRKGRNWQRHCHFLAAAGLGLFLGLGLAGPSFAGSPPDDAPDEPAHEADAQGEPASSLFFHGMGRAGLTEAAAYAHAPDLYAQSPKEPFRPSVWSFGNYTAVGGYSAGRLPAMSYLRSRGDSVKYAFILDPSWDDRIDYGATVILPWLRQSPDHQMLMIVGPASEGQILERYVGAVRDTPEWQRLTICHTRDPHSEMRRYIPAIANPAFRVGRCE